MTIKLYKNDYVRINNGKLVEGLGIIYASPIDQEELENAKECGDTFIRMIELPKELQDKYINYKRKIK